MATVRRNPHSPYWIAVFRLPDGRQTNRSTKLRALESERRKALLVAEAFERAYRECRTREQIQQVLADATKAGLEEIAPRTARKGAAPQTALATTACSAWQTHRPRRLPGGGSRHPPGRPEILPDSLAGVGLFRAQASSAPRYAANHGSSSGFCSESCSTASANAAIAAALARSSSLRPSSPSFAR